MRPPRYPALRLVGWPSPNAVHRRGVIAQLLWFCGLAGSCARGEQWCISQVEPETNQPTNQRTKEPTNHPTMMNGWMDGWMDRSSTQLMVAFSINKMARFAVPVQVLEGLVFDRCWLNPKILERYDTLLRDKNLVLKLKIDIIRS